jgi:hypothetical protein
MMVEDLVPDLILLDLKMPRRAGLEVLEAIKRNDGFRRIPVAVPTSSDRDEDVARSYGLGRNHFITKPGNPAELEQRLRSLFKDMEDLSGIRRGSGNIEATAVSAVDPGSVAVRQFLLWRAAGVPVRWRRDGDQLASGEELVGRGVRPVLFSYYRPAGVDPRSVRGDLRSYTQLPRRTAREDRIDGAIRDRASDGGCGLSLERE